MAVLPRTVLAILVLFPGSVHAATPSAASHGETSLRAAVEGVVSRVKPALVRIHVVSTTYRDGRELKYQSFGSGAIVTPEGHIVTNHHVAGHAVRIFCTLWNREEIDAELIGTDPLTDIAVIRLVPDTPRTFATVAFGDSAAVEVGDHVLALGSPRALSQSVTLGIVSNTDMILPRGMGNRFELDGESVGSHVKWIAHDAVIYPGNSGGPLVNLAGEIVGINEISIGLGGAIPGNLAREVAEALMADGEVRRAWLGMTVQPLLKHDDREAGALITGALSGSPAEEAGVQPGDILLALDGKEVIARFDEDLPALNQRISGLTIGKAVNARVLRDGTEKSIQLVPEQRENIEPREREISDWGLTARNLSRIMAKEMRRDTKEGVFITSIRPGGPSGDAKPAIHNQDVLVRVNDTPIRDIGELAALTNGIVKESDVPVPVLATFERGKETFVTVVEVGLRDMKDPGLEVRKAWLPVETQVITRDVARMLGDASLTGFRVTRVYGGSTADAAGVAVGDLLVAVDGQALTASAPEDYEELPTLIRNYRAGTRVAIQIVRDGSAESLDVELERSPRLDREMKKYRDKLFDFTARDVTFFDRSTNDWEEDAGGVVVEEVSSGGWAALGLLNVGDLLLSVDDADVASVQGLKEAMDAIADAQPESVVMKVRRGIYTVFIELEPKWESPS